MTYSALSQVYDALYQDEQLNKLRLIRTLLNFNKEDVLLDIGFGTGLSLKVFNDLTVKGIDNCREFVSMNQECIFADAEAIPFQDNAFDIIISVTSMHNFNNPEKAINEIIRVAKLDAQVVVSLLKKSKSFVILEQLLKKRFDVVKVIEEKRDVVFVLRILNREFC